MTFDLGDHLIRMPFTTIDHLYQNFDIVHPENLIEHLFMGPKILLNRKVPSLICILMVGRGALKIGTKMCLLQ